MGVDAINTSGEFKITRENVEKFLEKYYPDDDVTIKDVFDEYGWEIQSSKKDGVTKVYRVFPGWISQEEFEFFIKLAPYVENGSYIKIETIYDGASYTKWSFEDGKLVYYTGKQEIKWIKNDKPNYGR
jgi:hypothetical protein